MARVIAGFDPARFRAGIRTAMRMGMPVDEALWPEFVTEGLLAVDPTLTDGQGVPWDPAASVARSPQERSRPLCALEMNPSAQQNERWGTLQPGAIVLTLLDEEYETVKGFDYVNLWPAGAGDPVKYRYVRVLGQPNLDVVGVYEIECRTEDEV